MAIYGPIAGGISVAADFVQPIFQLTGAVTVGALIIALAAYAGAQFTGSSATLIRQTGHFFSVLFLCSAAWWGLQQVIPGGRSNGAVVGILPGAEGLQSRLTDSMQRVEEQTRRVGDLLEAQAEKERKDEEELLRQNEQSKQQHLEGARSRIQEAGFSPDAKGLLQAIMNGSGTSDFEELNIKLTKPDVVSALGEGGPESQQQNLLAWIRSEKLNRAVLRELEELIFQDGAKLVKHFKGAQAKQRVCDVGALSIPIAEADLGQVCKLEGAHFAGRYAAYFQRVYAPFGNERGGANSYGDLDAASYSVDDLSGVPIQDVEIVKLSQAPPCTYYRGLFRFFASKSMSPYGSFETAGSTAITWFDVAASSGFADRGFESKCSQPEVISRRAKQCEARVVMATSCEGFSFLSGATQPVLVKVLD